MKQVGYQSGAIALLIVCANLWCANVAVAAGYKDTVEIFRQAGESSEFFARSYGYAVFPTVGAGAIGIGGAYGKGRVYVQGKMVGTATLTQVSLGFQLGGKTYSQIIFFEDKRAFDDFASGKFEFGADASVIAVTSAAHAEAATNGVNTSISEGQHDASTRGNYQQGLATFVVAKGGLMASASIAGQQFAYQPLAAAARAPTE
jgi:lipid-binding SYLF domain-containing protein